MTDISPRAIAGFQRRYERERNRRKIRAAEGYGPLICRTLKRMAPRSDDMRQIGQKFGFPDDQPGTPRVQLGTIKEMYRLGLVRIIGRVGGVFIELTAFGKKRAAVLSWVPTPPGRPGRLPMRLTSQTEEARP